MKRHSVTQKIPQEPADSSKERSNLEASESPVEKKLCDETQDETTSTLSETQGTPEDNRYGEGCIGCFDPGPPGASNVSKENPLFAVRPDLQTLHSRLETYATWPLHHVHKTHAWAEAGFFYLGKDDDIRCFCCGGRLEELEVEDDPWTDHAVHFPYCDFLRREKGGEFVERVRKNCPPDDGPFPTVPASLQRDYELEWEVQWGIERSEELRGDVLVNLREGNDERRFQELLQVALELGRREGVLHEKIGSKDQLEWLQRLVEDESMRRVTEFRRCKMHEDHASCTDKSDPCTLRRVLEAMDAAVTVNMESPINKKIVTESNLLVKAFIAQLAEINPLLQPTVELKGSTGNGLKTGRVDELDFLLRMENITLHEKDGWQVVPDSKDFKIPGDSREDTVDFHGRYQFVLSSERADPTSQGLKKQREELSELLLDMQSADESNMSTTPHTSSVFLSGSMFKAFVSTQKYFAVDKMQSTPRHASKSEGACLKSSGSKTSESGQITYKNNASTTEHERNKQESDIYFSFDGIGSVFFYFPPGGSYSVKMDVTPCMAFQHADNTVQWFVPKGVDNWCVVNEDPAELENSSVCQAIRVIKALRDAIQAPNSVYSKYIYWIVERGGTAFTSLGELSQHLTEYLSQVIARPVDSGIPSYAIVSTVVKGFRQNPHHSVCLHVLNALLHFEYIAPDGTPLCRHLGADERAVELMSSCIDNLLNLEGPEQVSKFIPDWYTPAPRCLAQHLEETYKPVHTMLYNPAALPHQSDEDKQGLPTPSTSASGDSTGVWEVYCVNRNTFVTSLLQQISINHLNLREKLSELQEKEDEDLFVATFSFSSEFAEIEDDMFADICKSSLMELLNALPMPFNTNEIMKYNPCRQSEPV